MDLVSILLMELRESEIGKTINIMVLVNWLTKEVMFQMVFTKMEER